MINPLIGKQAYLIQCFHQKLLLTPINIPIIFFSLFIISFTQYSRDTICEECFEFNVSTLLRWRLPLYGKVIFFDIFSKVLRHGDYININNLTNTVTI